VPSVIAWQQALKHGIRWPGQHKAVPFGVYTHRRVISPHQRTHVASIVRSPPPTTDLVFIRATDRHPLSVQVKSELAGRMLFKWR